MYGYIGSIYQGLLSFMEKFQRTYIYVPIYTHVSCVQLNTCIVIRIKVSREMATWNTFVAEYYRNERNLRGVVEGLSLSEAQ